MQRCIPALAKPVSMLTPWPAQIGGAAVVAQPVASSASAADIPRITPRSERLADGAIEESSGRIVDVAEIAEIRVGQPRLLVGEIAHAEAHAHRMRLFPERVLRIEVMRLHG